MHGVAEDNTAMYNWSPIEISVVVRSIGAVRDERPGGGHLVRIPNCIVDVGDPDYVYGYYGIYRRSILICHNHHHINRRPIIILIIIIIIISPGSRRLSRGAPLADLSKRLWWLLRFFRAIWAKLQFSGTTS